MKALDSSQQVTLNHRKMFAQCHITAKPQVDDLRLRCSVDVGGAYYNTNMQEDALEKLLTMLPDPAGPAAARTGHPNPPRPHQLRRRLTACDRAEIIATYEAGSSAKQLAAQWQLAKASILTILRDGGTRIRGQRRLTEDEIDHAVTSYQQGESLYRIGDRLNVAHTTVGSALERRGVPRRDTHGRS
ncbi:helix-turn-helix domain-containing protein [Nocardia sp. NPDC049707]|uniref:helix-turn-helix domain-containing protein n=1 Tax=Nocardia sp. NPDC049707 TaxID=3154735 RepID=UPI0034488837